MEFVYENAFLLDNEAIELSAEGISRIVDDILADWMLLGGSEPLALPTVKRGVFRGYFNARKNPIGLFVADTGETFNINEDRAILVKKAS